VKSIPVIGNGDVVSPEAARHMLNETGCAGVSIGRGAFYHPWIFRDTLALLRGGEVPPEPGYAERVRVMRRHLDLAVEVFGEELGCKLFRKPAAWYAKRLGPAREFKHAVVRLSTRAQFEEMLRDHAAWRAQFLDEKGELRPKFRPNPLVASFLRDGAEDTAGAEAVPVPRGPVELW